MDLNTYLFLNKISKVKFADRIGVDRTHLHRIISGNGPYPASRRMAQRIEKATFGKVTIDEVLSLYKLNKNKLKDLGIPEIAPDSRQLDMLKEKS